MPSAAVLRVALLVLLVAAPALDAQATGLGGRAAADPGPVPPRARPEAWTFDESTTGAPIAWSSPTSVDPAAAGFLVGFTIDAVEVSVSFLGIPFGSFDVTDQIPPDMLQNAAYLAGPAPIVLLEEPVVAPPPPDPPALAATLSMGLDATGTAQLLATDIALGTTQVDVGPPFGTVTVTITGFRIAGSVSVLPIPWSPVLL